MTNGQELNIERTEQATERTFLAYIRTSLTTFAVGVTFIKFFDNFILKLVGWIFMPAAIIVFIFGFRHYRKLIKYLSKVKNGKSEKN